VVREKAWCKLAVSSFVAKNAARILFLCTGNYYRSRFAEILFNHLAQTAGLPHRADSAGLAPHCWERNPGPISPHTLAALAERHISSIAQRLPRDVAEAEFSVFTHVIAMKETEHRPMMDARFPTWATHISYWAFDDIEDQPASVIIPKIEIRVRELLAEL